MFVPCPACQVQLGTDDGTTDGPEEKCFKLILNLLVVFLTLRFLFVELKNQKKTLKVNDVRRFANQLLVALGGMFGDLLVLRSMNKVI